MTKFWPFLILMPTIALLAQSDANKGQIAGTVYDPAQGVISGARIRIENPATGSRRELVTTAEGRFRAVLVDAGTYNVAVEATSFAPAQYTNLTLNVGGSVNLEVILQLGITTQSIDVQSAVLVADLPNPTTVISRDSVENLPINGRRFQDFATLTPTVQVDVERGQLSFMGQRGINSNVMVDGTDYNNPFFGGIRGGERSNSIITLPQSAVQEFQAVTAGYSAEYGRSSGGVLNVITRSGANKLRGEAFYQLRHKETGLSTPFHTQNLETQHQFGGGAGGAIRKDRLFWYGAVERQNAGSPEAVRFASLDSIPVTANNQEAYSFYRSLETGFRKTNDATALIGRADYQTARGTRLTLRYSFSDAAALNSTSVGGASETITTNTLSNNGTEQDRTHNGVAQWTSILNANSVNDLRVSVSQENRPRTSNSSLPGVSNSIGQYGARNFLPTYEDDRRTQFNDGLSLSRGAHTFKLGADYNRLSTYQFFGFNQFGLFTTNVGSTDQILETMSVGGPTADRFDNPLVQYQLQIGNLVGNMTVHQIAAFIQDTWRITHSFSLSYGLRWEGQKNQQPEANNTALVDKVKSATLLGGVHLDPSTAPDALNQWMPRLGLTWTPGRSAKTVFRGHAGIFYAATPLLVLIDATNNFRLPPGNVSLSLPRANSTVYRDLLAIGIDLNKYSLGNLPLLTPDQIARAAAGSGAAPDPFANARLTAVANNFTNPRSVQAGFGVERSVSSSWTLGGQFNYLNTVHLERNHDVNLPNPQINSADAAKRPNFGQVGTFRIARPIPTLDRIVMRESSARSMYRGATWNTQYNGHGFQVGANYTLSGTYSDDDNERSSSLYYQDAANFTREYSVSRMDARHQVSGYGVGKLRWGITVSGTFRFHTGFPIDAAAGSDMNGDGNYVAPTVVGGNGSGTSDRPYIASGVSMARYAFRNRPIKNVDFRFLKSFRLPENRLLQFSVEMFNMFNWDNVQIDRTNLIYGPGIDSVTGATVAPRTTFLQLRLPNGEFDPTNNQVGTPFQAQFGLRLFF